MRSISWLEDDIGFVSTDANSNIAVWMLPRIQANAPPNVPLWTFNGNNVNFTSTVAFKMPRDKEKDKEIGAVRITVFASASDSFIYEIVDRKLVTKYETAGGI